MKLQSTLVVALVAVLAVAAWGCVGGSATGGGFIIDDGTGAKVTFGFTGSVTPEGTEGLFQLVDHSTKPPARVHGSFDAYVDPWVTGMCYVNGEGPYYVQAMVNDLGEPGVPAGDSIDVEIKDGTNPTDPTLLHYAGALAGGNIQFHPYEE
jgi:hypothetical protein